MAPRHDVREVQDRGHYWQVIYDVTYDNGFVTEHGHSIPKETLEWRAAEYQLDPVAEFETILDIVLAEPYIDEAEQVGRVTGQELIDAPDIPTARAHHLSRCARAKLKHRITTRKVTSVRSLVQLANPLDVIRNGAVIDPVVVAVKQEHVRKMRLDHADRRNESPSARAERVAEALNVDLEIVVRGMRKNG